MGKWSHALGLDRFLASEEGGITALSLHVFLASLVLGGLAIDYGNAEASKTQLQAVADSAAHAAIVKREFNAPSVAKAAALELAADSMPVARFGKVLNATDIQFGRWDGTNDTFVVNPNSREAVMVSTKRFGSNGNGVGTFLLRLVGRNFWNVQTSAVYETYYPTCFEEGFVAEEQVEIQSNSVYGSGFCIHSQDRVKVSSNNTFERGTIVSMPDKSDVEMPSSGIASNPGLAEALRDGFYNIRILGRINDIYTGLMEPSHAQFGVMTQTNAIGDPNPYYREYVKRRQAVTLNYKFDAQAGTFTEWRIHYVTCKQDKWTYDLNAGAVLKNGVLVTNCRLTIHAGAIIEDAVIFVANTEDTAVRAPSTVTIGKNDNCAEGGDVQIVTTGGVSFASGAQIFGSQIIAAKDISLTANANGLEGVSLVAGGKLDVTSNGAYGFCGGNGMARNYEAAYFRLAR